MTRKERSLAGGEGVFIAVYNKYPVSHEISLDSDCEMVWLKMPLHIGCYYRTTDRNGKKKNVHELRGSLDGIPKRGSCLPNFLTVNFNVFNINWESQSSKPDPQYGMEKNETMCELYTEHDLSQNNMHPTRLNSVLYFLCTTSPDPNPNPHSNPE